MQISNSIQNNEYAKIIDTIPGIGKYGALSIAAEIGNVDRFPREDNIFSYAGYWYKGYINPDPVSTKVT